MKIKSKISDAVNPDQFRQVSETEYVFQKDGQDAYTLNKKDKHWECSCPAYKFHKKCKHSQLLEEQLKPDDEEKPKRHPRAEMEKFIPELTEICSPFEVWKIAGSWRRKCFAKGTLVRTFYGKKPIEEIQVGDIVFNGEGNLTKVTDVVSYPTNKWVRVNYRRDSSIVCTPDHQFLIWKSNSPRKAYEWEPADNMNHHHWKMITPKLNLPEDLSIGWIYAFLLGWYLADGNMYWQKDKTNARFPYKGGGIYHVTLAADSMRVTEFLHLIADLGFRNFTFNSNEENNSLLITIRDHKLIEFLLKWGGIHCPPLGEDKFGNFDILRLKKEEKKAFVQGFWLGDGSYGKYNNAESVRIYNSNKEMIEILDNILSEDYRTLRYVDCRADKFGGKYKDLYEVRISADQANNFISTMEDVCADAKYLDKRINKFKRVIDADKQFPVFGQNMVSVDEFEEDGICYCISVEDGESFIADNFVVHNCSTFKDIDVIALASSEAWKQVHQNLVDSGAWEEFIFGPTLMRGMYHGYYLDFNLCPSEDDWLWWLIYRTGSQAENVALRKRAIQMGYAISEKGVQDRFTFEYVDGINTEADFYHFLGLEYRKPEERDGQNFKELKDWKMEEHLSPGKQAMDQGDFDWHDYIIASIDKLKDRTTVYRSAKYPARLAILVAREIARRVNQPVEAILKNVTPEEIQPEGFKKGQQTWDKDGNVITVK